MKRAMLILVSIFLLLIVSFSGCISNDGDGNGNGGDKDQDKTRYFEFKGTVTDYTTGEPLADVSVSAEAEWTLKYDSRGPPIQTYTKELGHMNTVSDGEFYLKVPVHYNESANNMHYNLIFSRSKYFAQDKSYEDTGGKLMVHYSNVTLEVKVVLSGYITDENDEPLDDSVVIVNPTGDNIVWDPDTDHIVQPKNGKYNIWDLSSKRNYDIIIGRDGYQTRIIEDVHLPGHVEHVRNVTLTPINYSARNVTVNGSINFRDHSISDFFRDTTFFIWVFDKTNKNIEIIDVNETGNFSVILTQGSYSFYPIMCPEFDWVGWDFSKIPLTISEDTEIEILGEIYYP